MEEKPVKWTKKKIIRNVVFLILIWICIFTPYTAIEVLQTSINGPLGIYSVSLHYGCRLISSFFGPIIIRKLTPKYSVLVASVCLMTYVVANFYPKSYTLLPAGVLLGLSQGPLWICHGIYGTFLSAQYAKVTGQALDDVLSRVNGFLAAAMPGAIILGGTLNSLILDRLKLGSNNDDLSMVLNSTVLEQSTVSPVYTSSADVDLAVVSQCGPNYCPAYNSSATTEDTFPDIRVFYILVSVLGCINACAILLSIFGLQDIPLIHFQSTQIKGMFPRAYITCNIGVDMIGYITMVKGITDFLTSILLGFVGHACHRNVWLLFGFVIAIVTVIMLYIWNMLSLNPNEMVIALFILSGFAGCVNGINMSLSAAFVGAVFTNQKAEAFSFVRIVSSIVQGLSFYSNVYLCVQIQLYIFTAVVILSGVTFVIFCIYLKMRDSAIEGEPEKEKDITFISDDSVVTKL